MTASGINSRELAFLSHKVCYVVVASGSFDLEPSQNYIVECVFSAFFTIELALRTVSFTIRPFKLMLHTRFLFFWIDTVTSPP